MGTNRCDNFVLKFYLVSSLRALADPLHRQASSTVFLPLAAIKFHCPSARKLFALIPPSFTLNALEIRVLNSFSVQSSTYL